jgi:hypothetical protein
VCCPGWTFTPRARAWWAIPTGDFVRVTLGGEPGTGTRIGLDEGGLDLEPDLAWEVGLDVAYGRHRVRGAYEALSFEGTETFDETHVYRGVTFPAGEEVRSEFDLSFWKAGWDYLLVGCEERGLRVGLSGWLWTYEGKLEGESAPKTTRHFRHVFPVATADAWTSVGNWRLGATLGVGGLDVDRSVIDVSAYAGRRLGRRVEIDVGWRWMRFAFDETKNELDFVAHGPFVEVSVDF